MTRFWGNDILGQLSRPIYVIRMHQHRMSRKARIKWLRELRLACLQTLDAIDAQLTKEERHD